MPFYPNARITVLFYAAVEADVDVPVKVRVDNGQILVEYLQNGCFVQYTGQEVGAGHYKLTCRQLDGQASLHSFPSSSILEGYWKESGSKGMWRIVLGIAAPAAK